MLTKQPRSKKSRSDSLSSLPASDSLSCFPLPRTKVKHVSLQKMENKHTNILILILSPLLLLLLYLFVRDLLKQTQFHSFNHQVKTSTCLQEYEEMNCDSPIPELAKNCEGLKKCQLEGVSGVAIAVGILASAFSAGVAKAGWLGMCFLSLVGVGLVGVCLRVCKSTTTINYHYK